MRPTGYNVHSDSVRQELLRAVGLKHIDELFKYIPPTLKLKSPLELPAAQSEWEVEKHIRNLASKNQNAKTHLCFLGGGHYDHHIPAAVDALTERGEFLTAYTPYQPEMSQGLLQALYEYQQTVAKIIGLPVVNASSYDGATALAEAAWIMAQATKSKRILYAENIWPEYKQVLSSYCTGRDLELVSVPVHSTTGRIDTTQLAQMLKPQSGAPLCGGLLLQSPNCFGVIESLPEIVKLCHEAEALVAVSYNPWLSGLLTPPGLLGADVVSCEGQPLGLPLAAGGPSLGILATTKTLRRFLPGRIIGRVADIYGQSAYAMVYEDREQHVAREKATSNLCSNQALCAIRSVIYLALLGEVGFAKVAQLNREKAHYLAHKLTQLPGVRLKFAAPFFNEFLIELPCDVGPFLKHMFSKQIFAGLDYSGVSGQQDLLIAVTENKNQAELDLFASLLKDYLKK